MSARAKSPAAREPKLEAEGNNGTQEAAGWSKQQLSPERRNS
jgi:hypothetical protein